jgi:acyl-coenzyme A synthetase/AMP-(fatty) acid ligase
VNAAYNCIDRHLATNGDQPALIYEADHPNDGGVLTYRQLHDKVCIVCLCSIHVIVHGDSAVCRMLLQSN